jgi:hypothetical protein
VIRLSRRRAATRLGAVALGSMIAVAGCSSSSSAPSGSGSGSSRSVNSQASFRKCLAKHGVTLPSGGGPGGGFPGGAPSGPPTGNSSPRARPSGFGSSSFRQAIQACGGFRGGGASGGGFPGGRAPAG